MFNENSSVQEILEALNFNKVVRTDRPAVSPFCICRETRRGLKYFIVSDMRRGGAIRVKCENGKTATRVAKLIEQDQLAAWKGN